MALFSSGTNYDRLQSGTLTQRPTPPASDAGSIRFNTTSNEMEQWDGTVWSPFGGGGGGSSVTVSVTPPTSPTPSQGDLWWDSSDDGGSLYIYYTDANSSQWVNASGAGQVAPGEASGVTVGPNAPANPNEGDLWYNTNDSRLYAAVDNVGGTPVWVDASPDGLNPSDIFILDDISSQFNNTLTDFSLLESSTAITPTSAQQLILDLGGVIQRPGIDYTISGSTLTFTTAPQAGLTFNGRVLGSAINLLTPADGSVTPSKLDRAYVEVAGDHMTGDLGIGGTAAAPNISLNAGGEVQLASASPAIRFSDSGGNLAGLVGSSSYVFTGGTSNGVGVRGQSTLEFGVEDVIVGAFVQTGTPVTGGETCNLLIGGTLPSAPNITLAADGIYYGRNWVSSDGTNNKANIKLVASSDGTSQLGMEIARPASSNPTVHAIRFSRAGSTVGSITIPKTGNVSYNVSSDYRLKTDILPISGAIDRIKSVSPCNFEWIETGVRTDGFIAHELQEVIPEAVTGSKDEVDEEGNPKYQGIDQSKMLPLVVAAFQEALTRIETLESEVAALKGA